MQQTEDGRLRALLDAGIAVSSELSIDAVLQRIVEAAAELTGAAYAALARRDPTDHAGPIPIQTRIHGEALVGLATSTRAFASWNSLPTFAR